MRYMLLAAAIACAQDTDCNGRRNVLYNVHLKDGTVVQVCAFNTGWDYPDCLVLSDKSGAAVSRLCRVERWEYGVPTPPPPAENPRQ